MIPRVLLDTAPVPGGGELRLFQRGTEFSIMLGANELMNSRLSGSEEALATLSCDRLRPRDYPQVLIGGLGMGFTLRAALAALGPDAAITVAELVPAVIAWAKGPLAGVFGASLTDSRVAVHTGDVIPLIAAARATYDAILLDVDNGPDGLTRPSNDSLYSLRGLHASHEALRPNGLLAVWSSGPDSAFTQRLRKAGFAVEEHAVRASAKRGGARHMIWIAVKSARAS